MTYDIVLISNAVGGSLTLGSSEDRYVKHLLIDTRKVLSPRYSCFFALSGTRRDGHLFIPNAIKLGIRMFVVQKGFDFSPYSEAHFIQVEDTIQALQQLAAKHRRQFIFPVIAITGSNGKTIVKEWLFSLLQQDLKIIRSPGSFNSQIGVPLSVWQMKHNHELAIIEAGISTTEEMENLASIIQCDTGIILNIGSAHDAGFNNRQEKLEEKCKLFSSAHTIIYCADDNWLENQMKRIFSNTKKNLLSWGFSTTGEYYLSITKTHQTADHHTIISAIYENKKVEFVIPFDQLIDVSNALHCVTYMLSSNYDVSIINSRLSQLTHLEMRLEFRKGIKNTFVINDTYSNDPESLRAALSFLNQQSGDKEKAAILSGFKEQINENDQDGQEIICQMLQKYGVTLLIGVGMEIKGLCERLKKEGQETYHFENTDQLKEAINWLPIENKALLCKASRTYALDQIIPYLSAFTHKVRLLIDLDAMRHNVRIYTQSLQPQTRLMVMLKAHAYGSGDIELARFFEEMQADYMAVAVIDEALALRRAGIQTPILVLSPDPHYYNLLVSNKLSVEIYSLNQLRELLAYSKQGDCIDLHIKLDTGMHRLGMEEADLPELIQVLKKYPGAQVSYVFTHLACSSDPNCDDFSERQLLLFTKWHAILEKNLGIKIGRHALNSSAIIRFPNHHMEMVRLGIGLYGVSEDHAELQPVHTLLAKVVQIREIKLGDSVGYDRKWIASKNTKIAVVNIGYADGLMRSAGNGRHSLLINEQKAPIIGLVCMDMCMVDVSHIHNVKPGDDAVVFSPEYPIRYLAQACGTTAYEILSRLSSRIARVYTNAHY